MCGDLQHHRTFVGLDLPLFMLFIHGGIAVGWAMALSVFSTGVVPIYFHMSQFGLQHQAIINVIITGVTTLSTTHLLLTIKKSAQQYALMTLHEKVALERWSWIQAFAEGIIWLPFKWSKHKGCQQRPLGRLDHVHSRHNSSHP
jgi:hypothetical protein